jgi:chemotaxis protein CheC
MASTKNQLTNSEIDQLKEIANIGAGNASTALSHMLGKDIQMSVPESHVGDLLEVQRLLGNKNEEVLALFLKMLGDVNGAMLIVFTKESSLSLVQFLTKKTRKELSELDELDKSALLEVGNILLGASITALGKFLDINVLHSIPDLEVDMLGSIMQSVLMEVGNKSEKILAFKVNLSIEDAKISSDLYYLFDPESSDKILKSTADKFSK